MDRRRSSSSLATAITLLLWTTALFAAETVKDATHRFTLKVPEGFVPSPQIVASSKDILYAFALGDPMDDVMDIYIIIEKMKGLIGRERLKAKDMPPDFKGRLFTTRWQGFEVDAFEVPERLGEINTTTYNVQIPLKPVAIQVKLISLAERKPELDRLLEETLAGLKPETNWSAPAGAPSVAARCL